VHTLEQQWFAQSLDEENVKNVQAHKNTSTKFLGFDNVNFARHLRAVTQGVVDAVKQATMAEETRVGRKDEIGERQER